MDTLVEQAYVKAIELLQRNATQFGYQAAPVNPTKPDYSYLFGRDTSICALATLDHSDPQLNKSAVISLDALRQARSDMGQVPFRLNPATGYRDFWFPGNLDSTLWWVLASLRLVELYPQLLTSWQHDIEKSLTWLSYQDTSETGLLMQGQRADWADEMPSHGAVLYSNALWYTTLAKYQSVFPRSQHVLADKLRHGHLQTVKNHFQAAFWPYDDHKALIDSLPNQALKRSIQWANTDLVQQPYYMQWLSRRAYGWRCDLFANTLTLLTDLPEPSQRQSVTDHLTALQDHDPFPGRTLHPIIYPGDQDWQQAMIARNQDVPYQYHNGGIWPYIGGFWVSYLASQPQYQAKAQQQLTQLAQAVSINDWQFNEYFHGQFFTPMGIAQQSWNAAMYIAAYRAVVEYKPLFNWKPAVVDHNQPEKSAAPSQSIEDH